MAVSKFNLLYHVAPFARSDAWQKNVHQILKRIEVFNGRRIVAIATGPDLVDPEVVKRAFRGQVTEFLVAANNPTLRERASFIPMLQLVQSKSDREASFFAHAKGVITKGNTDAVRYWRNLMYHVLLDDMEHIKKLFEKYLILGTHRRRNVRFHDGKTQAPWHFAGTFFWFRHDAFFTRQWTKIPETGWGVEACPGVLFKPEEAACLVKEGIPNPYDVRAYKPEERIEDEEVPEMADGLKVEIGGGLVPKGNGYVNVDRDHGDVLFDFETLALGKKLPFETDSVGALYTSHCLEHIRVLKELMREIIRICKIGAVVEIRVPHWRSNMAMCHDHKQVIAPEQIEHWTISALDYWWGDSGKKLQLTSKHYTQGADFKRWKKILPHATEADILELCPNAAHESRWTFIVAKR